MDSKQVSMRGCGDKAKTMNDQSDIINDSVVKPLEDYLGLFSQNTEFFSSYNPNMIEDAILDYLRQQGVEPSKNAKNKYKVKFAMTSDDQARKGNKVEMQVQILKVDEKKVCIEFTRLSGDRQCFNEHYATFKNEVLRNMNDVVHA